MQDTSDEQVVVVGGGLVGPLQAILLSKRGFRVQLYESRPDMRTKEEVNERSMNLALSTRGREALRVVGLEQAALDLSIEMSARQIHPVRGKTYISPYGTKGECIYSINRKQLNKLLLTKAEEISNISLYFEHTLIRADLVGKKLIFQTGDANAGDVAVESTFIFGCDGAHSTVRKQMMRHEHMYYCQEYNEHGYKELILPPTDDDKFAFNPKYLHIWPREEFMMIAIPNPNRSFTLNLFMPFESFDTITKDNLLDFFEEYFPDILAKIGADSLITDYFKNPLCKLISVKCFPHFMAQSTLILGDAAHAVVPFYAQGMNAGFEDCLIFYNLLKANKELRVAAQSYQDSHWLDTQAIADLSVDHYREMRSYVNTNFFFLQKKFDNFLHFLFPRYFVPLYTMVAFTRIPYHIVTQKNIRQKLFKKGVCFLSLSTLVLIMGFLLFKFFGLEWYYLEYFGA